MLHLVWERASVCLACHGDKQQEILLHHLGLKSPAAALPAERAGCRPWLGNAPALCRGSLGSISDRVTEQHQRGRSRRECPCRGVALGRNLLPSGGCCYCSLRRASNVAAAISCSKQDPSRAPRSCPESSSCHHSGA